MRNNNPKYWETATVDINVRPVTENVAFLFNAYKSWVAYLNSVNLLPNDYLAADNKPICLYFENPTSNLAIQVYEFKTLACIHGQLVDELGYRIPLVDWLAHLEWAVYLNKTGRTPPFNKLPKCTWRTVEDIARILTEFKWNSKTPTVHIGDFYDEPVAVATSPKPPKIPTWLVALILVAVLAIASHAMFGYTVVNPQ